MDGVDKYCTLFDVVQTKDPMLGKMLTDCCMSGAIMRKSIIIPPDAYLKKVAKMSKDKMREALMDLVLSRPPYEVSKLKKLKDSEIKTIRGSTYKITTDKDKVMLNGVEIVQKKMVGKPPKVHVMLEAKAELIATPPKDLSEMPKKSSRKKVLKSVSSSEKKHESSPSKEKVSPKRNKVLSKKGGASKKKSESKSKGKENLISYLIF